MPLPTCQAKQSRSLLVSWCCWVLSITLCWYSPPPPPAPPESETPAPPRHRWRKERRLPCSANSMMSRMGPALSMQAPSSLITLGWSTSFSRLYSVSRSYQCKWDWDSGTAIVKLGYQKELQFSEKAFVLYSQSCISFPDDSWQGYWLYLELVCRVVRLEHLDGHLGVAAPCQVQGLAQHHPAKLPLAQGPLQYQSLAGELQLLVHLRRQQGLFCQLIWLMTHLKLQ